MGEMLSLKKIDSERQGHSSDIKRHPTILRDKLATHASLSSQQELRLGRQALILVLDLLCSKGAGILQACPLSLHRGLNPLPGGSEKQQQDQHIETSRPPIS